MSDDITAVVMAGGMGTRLRPLTQGRAKPAVPFGGIYRIIDFTLSNCINSNLRRIFVLTQYKSHSLSNHLRHGWGFLSRRLDHFIDEIPAQMQLGNQWYAGTADAIRQNLSFIDRPGARMVLVLSGDHVYKMDYRLMASEHLAKHADLTVSVARIPVDEASGVYGVVEVDEHERVIGFEEKPERPKPIADSTECFASMGVYLFDRDFLIKCLRDDHEDFGSHVVPTVIESGARIYAYDFTRKNRIEEYEYRVVEGKRIRCLAERASDSDYWRDVGTIESLWCANLDLVSPTPRFNLYGEKWPLFGNPLHFPPAKFVHDSQGRRGMALNSIISDGVIISGATIRHSVVSPGVYVHSYATVENSVLLGGSMHGGIRTETMIGRFCQVRNAIIDKDVVLAAGTRIGYDRADDERRGITTCAIKGTDDYIAVVPRHARLDH